MPLVRVSNGGTTKALSVTRTQLNSGTHSLTISGSSSFDYLILVLLPPSNQMQTDGHLRYTAVVPKSGTYAYGYALAGVNGARSYTFSRSGDSLNWSVTSYGSYECVLTGAYGTNDAELAGLYSIT